MPQWTQSQKNAFPFVQSGVTRQMTATDALAEFRAGGGRIRDAYWYDLYRQHFAQVGVKETITQIPMTYMVREAMFEEVDWDLRSKYAMTMEASGVSEELQMRITKYVTVESDKILTKAEWRSGAQQAIDNTLGSPVFVIDRISDYGPYVRMETT